MNQNLDALKDEIREYLVTKKVAIFQGILTDMPNERPALWDVDKFPDYRGFVDCAIQAGAKLMVFNWRSLLGEMIDEALDRLEEAELSREEQRSLQRRLKELRPYAGFTCSVDLMFEYQDRLYVYTLFTDWYQDLLGIVDQIEEATPTDFDDEEDEGEMGYFSRN